MLQARKKNSRAVASPDNNPESDVELTASKDQGIIQMSKSLHSSIKQAIKNEQFALADTWLKEAGYTLEKRAEMICSEGLERKIDPLPSIQEVGLMQHLSKRFERSSISRFATGNDLMPEDAEAAVNVFILVNALFISIPFGVLSSLGSDFWNNMKKTMESCEVFTKEQINDTMNRNFLSLFNLIFGGAYSSLICITMAAFFYIMRPKDKFHFHQWWKRARYVVFLLFLGTIVTGAAVMTLLFWLMAPDVFYTYDSRFCNGLQAIYDLNGHDSRGFSTRFWDLYPHNRYHIKGFIIGIWSLFAAVFFTALAMA